MLPTVTLRLRSRAGKIGKGGDLVDKVATPEEGRFTGPGSQSWKIPGPADFFLDISYHQKLYKTHIYCFNRLGGMGTPRAGKTPQALQGPGVQGAGR